MIHMTLPEANDRLNSFAKLEPNWNSYGAKPIDRDVIVMAKAMLWRLCGAGEYQLTPVPMSDGGIQLEGVIDGHDFECQIYPKGA